jgi:glycosyltransferase involved in cell wall biosynthesis
MAEMPQVYRDHDALLFTSEWEEPFALTPLEAMACGLPVIATVTGGSAELFRHRENALTYRAGDAEELAERIVTFAEDPGLREQCARAGFDEVRRGHGTERIVDQIEAYLQQTVSAWEPGVLPAYDA